MTSGSENQCPEDIDARGHAGTVHHDCIEALHELYHFLDGELTDDKRHHIRRHLEGCPPCFEAFDFEAEIKAYIADKCRERVPENLRVRIAEAIGHEPPGA
jgi:anti-sigma factor (TIGR02949 family)